MDDRLDALGLDYVDLLFVHQAMGSYETGYRTVVETQEAGKARCIGLSNFTDQQFANMVETTGVIPQVAQYEGHLHLQRHAAQGFLAQYGVQLEDWFPLGGKGTQKLTSATPRSAPLRGRWGAAPRRSSSAGTCRRAA